MFIPNFVKISQRVSQLLRGHDLHTEFLKGHNFVKTVSGLTILVLSTLSYEHTYEQTENQNPILGLARDRRNNDGRTIVRVHFKISEKKLLEFNKNGY